MQLVNEPNMKTGRTKVFTKCFSEGEKFFASPVIGVMIYHTNSIRQIAAHISHQLVPNSEGNIDGQHNNAKFNAYSV